MPGVLAIITPDNAPKLPMQGRAAADGALRRCCRTRTSSSTASTSRWSWPRRWSRRTAAAAQVRVQLSARRAGHVDGCGAGAGLSAEEFPQRRTPAGFSVAAIPTRRSTPAAAKVDATYITPIEHHNPMEPHATIARWDGDRLTVWTATQGISGAQATLAGLFGIDAGDVRVICPYLGGGFGCKGNTWPPATLAAMAREGRRPAGEARGDARADVHLERLSPAHRAEAAVRRRRPRASGVDAA